MNSIDMSMLSIYHLVSFSKKYPYHIYVGYQTKKFTLLVLPLAVPVVRVTVQVR